jgi:phenylalanine-4-hydroxylase
LINEDHPGFNDAEYKNRRKQIVEIAHTYMHGTQIPRIEYNAEETKTWGAVYNRLKETHQRWACEEVKSVWSKLEENVGYGPDKIPQLQDISSYLKRTTGFSLRPVSGLLSARDFLNALAFRVFFSTQYVRHGGNPFYTPEPDVCHELLGHVPLFADPSFADFSQAIGLASLAASDEDIDRLSSVYWFTVEFGLLKEKGEVKAFGAGLLSSFGELEWSCSENPSEECRRMGSVLHLKKPEVRPFDPFNAANQPFPITTYQPVLYCAEDMKSVKHQINTFCDSLLRPFFPQYCQKTKSVNVTRAVCRRPRKSTVRMQAEKQAEFFKDGQAKAGAPEQTADPKVQEKKVEAKKQDKEAQVKIPETKK